MAGMSLGVHSFVESSDRPRLPKSCAVWQGTLTLAVRNALAFGGNVYAEDEIHGASVNHEELFSCTFSCLRICQEHRALERLQNRILSILCFVKRILSNYTVLTTLYWRSQIRSQLKSLQSVPKYIFCPYVFLLTPLLRKLCILKLSCLGLLNSRLALWNNSLDAFKCVFQEGS